MEERFRNGTDGVMVSVVAKSFLDSCPKLANHIWKLLKKQPKGEVIKDGLPVDGTASVFYFKHKNNSLIFTVIVFWNDFEKQPGWAVFIYEMTELYGDGRKYNVYPIGIFTER